MNNTRQMIQDNIMAGLLAQGVPMELGLPTWYVQELLTRKSHPVLPEDVLGTSRESRDNNILMQAQGRVGYTFSWGTLDECFEPDEDDETLLIGTFEFCPRDVILRSS